MKMTYLGTTDEQIEALKHDLQTKLLKVVFNKKSTGEERVMYCTTSPHIVEGTVKGTGRAVANPIVPAFDTEAKDWRSFDMTKVTLIEAVMAFED
jgi:hypothetical protein